MKICSFLKIIPSLTILMMLTSQSSFALDNSAFDGLIINENAVLGICGEIPYERDPRDCLNENTDLKLCLHLNKVDPRFKRTRDNSTRYSCVKSSSSSGAEVIRELLNESDSIDGCLARNVRSFYEDLIQSEDFRELSTEFETQFGTPLVINFAIDTRDSVASLELDLKEANGQGLKGSLKEEAVNLLISRFSSSSKEICSPLDHGKVLGKVTNELTRLAMIKSRQKYDPINQEDYTAPEQSVYDSGRYAYPVEDTKPTKARFKDARARASVQ